MDTEEPAQDLPAELLALLQGWAQGDIRWQDLPNEISTHQSAEAVIEALRALRLLPYNTDWGLKSTESLMGVAMPSEMCTRIETNARRIQQLLDWTDKSVYVSVLRAHELWASENALPQLQRSKRGRGALAQCIETALQQLSWSATDLKAAISRTSELTGSGREAPAAPKPSLLEQDLCDQEKRVDLRDERASALDSRLLAETVVALEESLDSTLSTAQILEICVLVGAACQADAPADVRTVLSITWMLCLGKLVQLQVSLAAGANASDIHSCLTVATVQNAIDLLCRGACVKGKSISLSNRIAHALTLLSCANTDTAHETACTITERIKADDLPSVQSRLDFIAASLLLPETYSARISAQFPHIPRLENARTMPDA